jgi:hypothetical protein
MIHIRKNRIPDPRLLAAPGVPNNDAEFPILPY